MSNPRLVTAYGKQIWVDTLDTSGRKTKRKDFTQLPLEWAAGAAKAAGIPGTMVLILLAYMAWKTKSATFPLSNMLLAEYGVTRYTKYRILANLEKEGWIKLQRDNKQALLVTLLVVPK
jgi:CRP-like cAMP-binding protein